MIYSLLLMTLGTGLAMAECSPGDAIVAKLRAEFAYYNGLGANKPYTKRFLLARRGEYLLLRDDSPGPYYDPSVRPIYVYLGPRRMTIANCPPSGRWADCALSELNKETGPSAAGENHPSPDGEPCRFELTVPRWAPSPNDARKRELASFLLAELQKVWASEYKRIVFRDFNVNDPDFEILITDNDGELETNACRLDGDISIHCRWHLFGTVPREKTVQEIMARPYRLYPPLP